MPRETSHGRSCHPSRAQKGQPSGGLPRSLPEFSVCRKTFACRSARLCQRTLARRTFAVGTRARGGTARERRETSAQRIAHNSRISCFTLLTKIWFFVLGPWPFRRPST